MLKDEILATLRNATFEFYQLGMRFNGTTMIAPKLERSISRDAGPLRFLVEPRHLDDEAIGIEPAESGADLDAAVFSDYGPSLHIYGVNDGLEHLRFDCFVQKPHYHYARYDRGEIITVRIDQYAEGDPLDWTLGRLRRRLPEMLEYAGMLELGEEARKCNAEILLALDEIEDLLKQAGEQASEEAATALT
jgi:hypothetical protein